jgi:hypothetical protein
LSPSLGYIRVNDCHDDSFIGEIELRKSIEQEVGKGHIEPAIYITPYLKMREKSIQTHTSKEATGASLWRVCSSYALPDSKARSQWQGRKRGNSIILSSAKQAKRSLPCVREKNSFQSVSKKSKNQKIQRHIMLCSNAKCRALSNSGPFVGIFPRVGSLVVA